MLIMWTDYDDDDGYNSVGDDDDGYNSVGDDECNDTYENVILIVSGNKEYD